VTGVVRHRQHSVCGEKRRGSAEQRMNFQKRKDKQPGRMRLGAGNGARKDYTKRPGRPPKKGWNGRRSLWSEKEVRGLSPRKKEKNKGKGTHFHEYGVKNRNRMGTASTPGRLYGGKRGVVRGGRKNDARATTINVRRVDHRVADRGEKLGMSATTGRWGASWGIGGSAH